MSSYKTAAEYKAAFDPKEYLNEFYIRPDPEDRFIIQFMVAALRNMPSNLLALEFGGGPTLYAVATLAPQTREIHFCDYVEANLEEVQGWLDNSPDAFDWRPYIKMVLEEENKPTTSEMINHRMAEMRRKITRLTSCDALADAPLGQDAGKYDLVVAQTCIDSAASSIPEWMQIMRNISTLVIPDGWLLISVITGTSAYSFGQKSFPNLHLTDKDLYRGYMAAGYDPNTFCIDTMAAPGNREYSGLTTAIARKLNNSSTQSNQCK